MVNYKVGRFLRCSVLSDLVKLWFCPGFSQPVEATSRHTVQGKPILPVSNYHSPGWLAIIHCVVVLARRLDPQSSAGPQQKTQWRDRGGESVNRLCNHIVWMQLSDPPLEGSV